MKNRPDFGCYNCRLLMISYGDKDRIESGNYMCTKGNRQDLYFPTTLNAWCSGHKPIFTKG